MQSACLLPCLISHFTWATSWSGKRNLDFISLTPVVPCPLSIILAGAAFLYTTTVSAYATLTFPSFSFFKKGKNYSCTFEVLYYTTIVKSAVELTSVLSGCLRNFISLKFFCRLFRGAILCLNARSYRLAGVALLEGEGGTATVCRGI